MCDGPWAQARQPCLAGKHLRSPHCVYPQFHSSATARSTLVCSSDSDSSWALDQVKVRLKSSAKNSETDMQQAWWYAAVTCPHCDVYCFSFSPPVIVSKRPRAMTRKKGRYETSYVQRGTILPHACNSISHRSSRFCFPSDYRSWTCNKLPNIVFLSGYRSWTFNISYNKATNIKLQLWYHATCEQSTAASRSPQQPAHLLQTCSMQSSSSEINLPTSKVD